MSAKKFRQFILPLLLLGVGLWYQISHQKVPGESDSYPSVVRYTAEQNSLDIASASQCAAAYREKVKASKVNGVVFTPKYPSAPTTPVTAINAEGEKVSVTFPVETVTTANDIGSLPEALKPWEKEIKVYLDVQDRLRPVLHAPTRPSIHSQQAWLAMGVSAGQPVFETPGQVAQSLARAKSKQEAAGELRQATYVLQRVLGDNRQEFEAWYGKKQLFVAIPQE